MLWKPDRNAIVMALTAGNALELYLKLFHATLMSISCVMIKKFNTVTIFSLIKMHIFALNYGLPCDKQGILAPVPFQLIQHNVGNKPGAHME